MRLGQLARKLEISTDKIVDFLASRQITIDPGANTRLEPEHETLILQKFAPELLELPQEKIEEEIVEEPVASTALAPEPASEPVETTPPTQQPDELPELIKAPKVELPGLKVIGKIELPEKKKKEPETTPPAETTEGAAPQKTFSENRRPQQYQKRPAPPPHKNPIALQREREEREARKKRELARQQEKEKRAQHYFKAVKPSVPSKPARIVQEETEEMPVVKQEMPKTWWGRFMRWLNT